MAGQRGRGPLGDEATSDDSYLVGTERRPGAVPFLKELLWHDFKTSSEPEQKLALLGQLGWNQLGQLEEKGRWVACSTTS